MLEPGQGGFVYSFAGVNGDGLADNPIGWPPGSIFDVLALGADGPGPGLFNGIALSFSDLKSVMS